MARVEDIVCKLCGTHAASGESFCGGCGAFLEWEGERIVAEPESASVPAAPDSPAPAPEAPAYVAPAEPAGGAASAPQEGSDGDGTTKAQPIAVQPAVPIERPKPAALPRPSRKLDSDAVYCGSCGDANAPERRFCRRCGALLEAPAPVAVVRLPWWRRLFGQRAATTAGGGSSAGARRAAPPAGTATSGGGAAAGAPAPAPPGQPAIPKAPPVPEMPASPRLPATPKAPAGLSHSAGSSPVQTYHPPRIPGHARSITPPGLPKRSSKLGKGALVVVVLAVIAFAAVPSLRHTVTNAFHNIVTKPKPIPLAGVPVSRNHGACQAAVLGQDNATLYWYTRPAVDGPESVTVSVAPSFTGSVSSIVFTPLVANPSTTLAGPSPHPVVLRLFSAPAGTTAVIHLQNPPTLQSVAVSVAGPTSLTLKLVSSDPGAARTTCAETGIVFEGKSS